jgi:hypothetical protein
MAGLLRAALTALDGPKPDEAALEKIDAGVEELLWARATAAEKSAAASEARREGRGRPSADLAAAVRRRVVMAARAGRRIPHVSLFYH